MCLYCGLAYRVSCVWHFFSSCVTLEQGPYLKKQERLMVWLNFSFSIWEVSFFLKQSIRQRYQNDNKYLIFCTVRWGSSGDWKAEFADINQAAHGLSPSSLQRRTYCWKKMQCLVNFKQCWSREKVRLTHSKFLAPNISLPWKFSI